MKSALWIRRGLIWVTLILLLIIPMRADAGSPIDGHIVISDGTEQEVSPSIAYNSERKEYLVVWYNDRAGCDDIRAQRISATGQLAGGPFYISAGCNLDRRYPDVAYNSTSDQYLVVWEQYDPSTTWYSIKARRVDGSGALLDTSDITIQGDSNLYTPRKPAVSYASTSDRYLVVWAETWHPMPITYYIYGQVMTSAGALEGSEFSISTNTNSLEEPDLAYNRHANRYLVVWQLDSGSLYDIHGQQVHGGGGLYQTDITIAWYIKSCTNPAIASIPTTPTDEKFLVAWEVLYATNDHDIYGRLIEEDGTPGSDFWISWSDGIDETSPAIAASESNLQYFVTWSYPQGVVDKPIRGRAVTYSGSLTGTTAEFSGVDAGQSAVAAGPVGDFLVAWRDQPLAATDTNLYGQLWGNRIYLPIMIK